LSRGGSAASVFRGRPEENVSKGPAPEDDSAQKILLSLRTPTMSFEDNGGDKGKKVSGLALSPDASPNQQRPIEQLFEVSVWGTQFYFGNTTSFCGSLLTRIFFFTARV
jgi:hypothetical protein